MRSAQVFFLAGLALAAPQQACAAAAAAPRPNIVVILSDDFGWGSLACYGAEGVRTPACDRLAREGRRFTNAYAPGSVCSPTRYALMTGRYFWRTPIKDGYALLEDSPLHIEPTRLTLASLAKSQGYRTAAIGKWHLGLGLAQKTNWNQPLTPGPLSVGFDYFFGLATHIFNHPRTYVENDMLLGRIPGQIVTMEGRGKDQKTLGIDPLPPAEEVMGKLTGKAVTWLEENRLGPFFLYFAPNAVHSPVAPSKTFHGNRYGKYGDFIEELDASVGRILKTLDELKLTDNTLVIFTSDNGGVLNPQGQGEDALALCAGLAINGVLRGGKHTIFEGGFREPFIVRWPGRVPADTVSDHIVCLSDVLATLASILKVPLPEGNAEDSLDVSTSWLGGAGAPAARQSVVLQAAAAAEYAVREGPWKLIEHENRPAAQGRNPVVERRTIEQRKHTPKYDELFNLVADPGEQNNVAADHPDVVTRLRKLLKETRKDSTPPPAQSPVTHHPAPKAPAAPPPDRRPTFNRARFFPAPGQEQAMLGGRFSGSNLSARAGFETLAEIKSVPAPGQWAELSFENSKHYRWIRYEAPPGSHGNVAEMEFYLGQRKAAGRHFGSFGWRGMRNWPRAIDGKTDTWFNSDIADGQFVGIDVGDMGSTHSPRMDPPPSRQERPLRVTLQSATPDAVIRYSFTECPGSDGGVLYKGPIPINRTTSIFAVAFKEGLAPSPVACGTYLFGARPGLNTVHIGNSLTQTTAGFERFALAAGYLHTYKNTTQGGGNTKTVSRDPALMKVWEEILTGAPKIDHFTVQPRFAHFAQADFDDEATYDLRFFDFVRAKFPQMQPWIYAEWPSRRDADRSSGWTPLYDSRMNRLYPTLTYEESSAALLYYIEAVQRKLLQTYRGPLRPRILPCSLAAGWLKNWLDHGRIPGLSAKDFDPIMFGDNVHPDDPGRYLIDLTWFAAFYRQSPLGKIPPVGFDFKARQAEALQRLAWDVIQNYPDCGLYEEGSDPCATPVFIYDGKTILLTSTTPGAWFRYTLDGTPPKRTSGYVYCGVITAQPGMRIKAIAYRSGMADSRVSELNLPQNDPGNLAAVLQSSVDQHLIPGAVGLVADRDKVLDLKAVGYSSLRAKTPMRTDDLFWIASMSKSITAAALMMLVDQGKVNVNDPVEKYLPEFKGQLVAANDKGPAHPPRHPITIKEILSHTSGMVLAGDPSVKNTYSLKDNVAKYAAVPLRQEPGTKFEYNNAGIDTAGRIIEVASGLPYAEFMQKRLFDPLGMNDTTFWPTAEQAKRLAHSGRFTADKLGLEELQFDKDLSPALIQRLSEGVTVPPELLADFGIGKIADYTHHFALPAGGLFSTAADLGAFCQMLLADGTYRGKRYLSSQAIRQMTAVATEGVPVNPQEAYGLGWFVKIRDDEGPSVGSYGHRGARRPVMWVDPANGLALVLLVERWDMPAHGQTALYRSYLKAAIDKYGKPRP